MSETDAADLVVQGPAATSADAHAIAKLCGAASVDRIADSPTPAFRLCDPQSRTRVAEAAAARRMDHAFVPRSRLLRDVRIVSMDMDSTLITIECIDEIADMMDLKPQVAQITEAAMRGEIDFRASLTRRVALLAGLPVEALERVYDERLRLTPGAEWMLERFHAAGAKSLLVSGGFTFFTDRLQARLDLTRTVSNTLGLRDGKLMGEVVGGIVDADGKAKALRDFRSELPAGLAVAIGDGANDLPLFRAADVSIAYRAKPVLKAQATHALDFCGLDAVVNLFV
jgi:phosphoserine phosphatase